LRRASSSSRVGAVHEADAVDLGGWVLGVESEALAVELRCDGEAIGRTRLGRVRPDLTAAFPDGRRRRRPGSARRSTSAEGGRVRA